LINSGLPLPLKSSGQADNATEGRMALPTQGQLLEFPQWATPLGRVMVRQSDLLELIMLRDGARRASRAYREKRQAVIHAIKSRIPVEPGPHSFKIRQITKFY
jgi:hypothetical protein